MELIVQTKTLKESELAKMTLAEEVTAMNSRTLGRNVRFGGGKRGPSNPFPPNSFHAYCWNAGYNQDTRNVHELHSDWLKDNLRERHKAVSG